MDEAGERSERQFSWPREARWIAIPALIGALARIPIVRAMVEVTHGDTAIVWLMMRRIATGEDFPLLYYGQGYMGAVDPFMAAPFYWLLGPQPLTLGVAQLVIFSLIAVPLVYRLLFDVGGRWGALIGTSLASFGTPWIQICTAGRYTGYLSTFWIGALLLLLGYREIRDGPNLKRTALCGLLAGLGWYNNPQIALFIAPLVLALWLARGRIPALRAEGRLVEATGRSWTRAFAWAVALGIIVCEICVFLCFVQEESREAVRQGADAHEIAVEWAAGPITLSLGTSRYCFLEVGGTRIKVGSPENYIPRVILVIVGLIVLAEYWLADDRRRWRRWAFVFAAAGVVGWAPMIVAKLQGTVGRSAPLDINPAWIPRRVVELRFADMVWFGAGEEDDCRAPAWYRYPGQGLEAPNPLLEWMARMGPFVRQLTIGLWVTLLVARLVSRRDVLRRALLGLKARLDVLDLLVIQQAVLLILYMQHPLWASGRYWIYGWMMLGGLVAWAVAHCRPRWLLAAGGVVLLLHYVPIYGVFVGYRLTDGRRLPAEHELLGAIEARGLVAGVADYSLAYHLLYMGDEKHLVICKRVINERLPENIDRMTETGGTVYRLAADWLPCDVDCNDGFSLRDFLERDDRGVVRRRWRRGQYAVYEYPKRAGRRAVPERR